MAHKFPSSKRPEILIVGCGNLLRSDDAVGPLLIRRLWQLGLPEHIEVVDGGTAGMDVAFKMAGRTEVVIVDACESGAEAGTIYEVPGNEFEDLPLQQANLHCFRWDHAIAFGRWLLKDCYPRKVTVFLVEGENFSLGMDLSPKVAAAMDTLARELLRRYNPEGATAVSMDGIRIKSLEALELSGEP